MFNKTGTVEAVRKDGKGVKMDDGQWYSSFLPVKGIRAGMAVSFSYTTVNKDGNTYNNIKGNIVEDTSGTPTPTASTHGFSGSRSGGTTSDKEKQLMIIRQNALTNAVSYFNQNVGASGGTEESEIKGDVATIVMIAQAFTRFTAGELDNDAKAAIESMSVASPLVANEKEPF